MRNFLPIASLKHATVLRDVVSSSSSWEETGLAVHTSPYRCRLNAAPHMYVICLKNKASSCTVLHPVSLWLVQDNDFAFSVFYHHFICLYYFYLRRLFQYWKMMSLTFLVVWYTIYVNLVSHHLRNMLLLLSFF